MNLGLRIPQKELQQAMSEFKVGSHFVLKDRFSINQLFRIVSIGRNILGTKVYQVLDGGGWPEYCVRPAKDEEIAAGHRIDNETLKKEPAMSESFQKWFENYENNAEYAASKIASDAYEAGQQSRQVEIDSLKGQLIKLGFTDNGGSLMKPPIGVRPNFDLLDTLQNRVLSFEQQRDAVFKIIDDLTSRRSELSQAAWSDLLLCMKILNSQGGYMIPEQFIQDKGLQVARNRLQAAKESGLDMWTYGWGFTTKQLEQALKGVNLNTLENFDLEKAIARRDKLRGRYNRSGLSNTDYNELLQLDKAIERALKDKKEGENNGQ